MPHDPAILYTKLNPPRLPRHSLVRARVDALIGQALDHRVTIVQASTGYGKSTALANLANADNPLYWYSATEGDADPRQFLAHLISAFHRGLDTLGELPFALLQDDAAESPRAATDALINALTEAIRAPSLIVIDDYHLAASPGVNALLDHFIAFLPADLHAIVATRYAERPAWEHLAAWRARGEILDVKREALAFTQPEIAALFRDNYGLELAPRDAALLEEKTEGWPIALQLVWQEMRANPQTDVSTLLSRWTDSLETLFAYLARDVLSQQPPEMQRFLLDTCVLRELEPAACRAVSDCPDSGAMLARLRERDLFIIALGEPSPQGGNARLTGGARIPRDESSHYRYHHLFHDFLRDHAAREDAGAARDRHRRAAEFYQAARNHDEAVYHWLRAEQFERAAQLLEEVGETVLRAGRLDTLAAWFDSIPPRVVAAHPLLMFYLGDLARLRSRFDDALAWYAQAERLWRAANDARGISRALRGQALIYLDTVRARQAEDLLQEALRLIDGFDDRAAQARLLELLAENKLNMGKTSAAEELRLQARTLREEGPSEDALSVRVKLRTGRLDEARGILETWALEERGKPHEPRSHRETMLVLALIYAMQGRAEDSRRAAEEGIAIGKALASPFITAVALTRLGHARQVCGDLRGAIQCYEESVALGDQLMVQRTRAEAMWGMTRAHGFCGDLPAAQRDAAEALQVTASAGDAWLMALIQIALGSSFVFARHDRDAIPLLSDAAAGMRACGDKVSQAAARMWLALAHWHLNQRDRAMTQLSEALGLAQTLRVDYLFTLRTTLGMQDPRAIVPLLLEARQRGKHAAYIARLLSALKVENVITHPGYQLRVQTLGAFRVWRGDEEIGPREWTRKKARQLYQFFISQRGRMIEREEILEMLYRDTPAEAASRDFKVALNALNNALQPARGVEEPAFIARDESAYGLRPGADVWIDAEEFSRLIAQAEKSREDSALDLYRCALGLYHDDYLVPDARYADWAVAERERLLALYLRAADRLAEELLTRGAPAESIAWCEKILARDPCWEHAYRLMMQAHTALGNRVQARRVFEQCTRVLRDQLDVEPCAATVEVDRQAAREQGAGDRD